MSLKHAILGFLSIKSMTGYDLKKAFDQSIQYFWPANQSQIYRTLAEMHAAGLIDPEVIAREERLDMKVYHISNTGLNELHRWLSTALPHQDYREAFLIQVYFGSRLSDQEVLPVIKNMIRDLETSQNQLTAMYKMYLEVIEKLEAPRELFFSMLPLEFGIASNQTALEWLNSAYRRLEAGDYTPLDSARLCGE